MSKMGQYRIELQERPEYQAGWDRYVKGGNCEPEGLTGIAAEAWRLGWNDAYYDMQVFQGS